MRILFIWTCMLGIFACNSSKSQSYKIPLEEIEGMFSKMKANGVYTDTILLWGYFFTSDRKDHFDQITKELKKQNFEFVEIFQADDKSYWLHLERKEIHNAKSLFELDKELYKIADKYKTTYDGFDVGNINKGQPIQRDTYTVPEEFKTTDYSKDNLPYLLVGNTAFDRFPHKAEFCHFVKVTTAFVGDASKTMLPTDEELNELDQFEHTIEKYLKENNIKCYYIFRDTHRGIRNFYIVTNDKIGTTKVFNSIKDSKKIREFNYEISTDKNWDLYHDFRKKIPNE
ncbi:DUF695 domain-containing protein [Sphingobacterium sp. BIGb0165]|uniref:DUF695 domain-containing protein n=1 Tax=Sphingobacterium sp. BIGb0165 TaxID=2940615 RepID=UPI002168468B|nr:DUF695 domain-containing protein [Sphingobacterium sp. BIGb0165]MCS4228931.1 hypothetical protein [Sphingobacterium sp. BIGb0165]